MSIDPGSMRGFVIRGIAQDRASEPETPPRDLGRQHYHTQATPRRFFPHVFETPMAAFTEETNLVFTRAREDQEVAHFIRLLVALTPILSHPVAGLILSVRSRGGYKCELNHFRWYRPDWKAKKVRPRGE